MITILHNNRCRKSREGLNLLENSGKDFTIVEYMKESISVDQLTEIVIKLGISPIELVRKKETIWKEKYKEKALSNEELIQIMVDNPKLIERPIVINGDKAIVGRPPEKILSIL